jgi:hypothetical protein
MRTDSLIVLAFLLYPARRYAIVCRTPDSRIGGRRMKRRRDEEEGSRLEISNPKEVRKNDEKHEGAVLCPEA